MSLEAITWALNTAPIPTGRNASTLASVLVGLANHADPEGRNAFPAVATLVRYTRLSERSVQYALRALEDLGLITPSDPGIVAAHVKRADRRPHGWDLPIHSTIHNPVHNRSHEVQPLHPAHAHGVQTQPHGVHTTTPRGAPTAPEPSRNHPQNRPPRERARGDNAPNGIPPVCGDCDARDTDPVSARIIWLDTDRQNSTPCPTLPPGQSPDRRRRTVTATQRRACRPERHRASTRPAPTGATRRRSPVTRSAKRWRNRHARTPTLTAPSPDQSTQPTHPDLGPSIVTRAADRCTPSGCECRPFG